MIGEWLSEYWPHVLLAVGIWAKALNLVTLHFRDKRGLVKWCLFLIDLLDVVKSSHGGIHGGIPGSPPPIKERDK